MIQSSGLTIVQKPATIQELGPVDIAAVKQMVARIPERVWNIADEQKENKFFCFHHTRHIVFRFIAGNRDPRDHYATPVWKLWEPTLRPLFDEIVAPYQFRQPAYPKAMLARLAAGHIIDSHVDGAGSNLRTHKIHVPIQTNEKAFFYANHQPFHLREGMAYEVNNIQPHAVQNRGDSDRIHLIFEVFDAANG